MWSPEVLIALRWTHITAGIIWIGLLYWFNLVNLPYQRVLDPTLKAMVNPPLFWRALAWFRWTAVVTVTAGFLMIYGTYWWDGDLFGSNSEITIFAGMTLGVIMLANVWLVIWPNQRKMLTAIEAGTPPDPSWPRNTLYASRTNFALSLPLVFFMVASAHYPLDLTGVIVVGVGLAAVGLAVVLTVQKYWAARF